MVIKSDDDKWGAESVELDFRDSYFHNFLFFQLELSVFGYFFQQFFDPLFDRIIYLFGSFIAFFFLGLLK